MPQAQSPTTRKRRLGGELRRLRNAAGVTAETAAAELDCSLAKIRHLEGGRNAPGKSDLRALLDLYGADEEIRGVLEAIRKEAAKPGWWSTMRLPKWLASYVGAETDAHTVSTFQLELVPGLLQIESYIRSLYSVADGADVDRHISTRARRQERLRATENPLQLNVVISEAVLHRIAAAEYAKEQFRHLIDMSGLPNVTLRVLPFSAGLHTSMAGGFVLLDFDPDVALPACYFEYVGGGQLVDIDDVVKRMAAKFAELQQMAMSEEDSIALIAEWQGGSA